MVRAVVLALLLMIVGLERAPAVHLQASIAPSARAYMGNGGGRDLPVYWKPRFRDLPIGYFPDGTRVEIMSGVVIADGHRWVRVRMGSGFDAWALTRTLRPNPPFREGGGPIPLYPAASRPLGTLRFCLNPAGVPRQIGPGLFADAVNRAIGLWQSAVGGKLPLQNLGECTTSPREHDDGVTVIGWGSPRSDDGKALMGASWTRRAGGRMLESDIELHSGMMGRRAGPAWLADRDPLACLSQTILHETGHMVGLGHPPDDVVSVMQPWAVCLRVTRLPDADVHNLRNLYP